MTSPSLELILKNALQWSRQHPGEKVKTIELSRGLKIRARVVEGLAQILLWRNKEESPSELEVHVTAEKAGFRDDGYDWLEIQDGVFQIDELPAVILPLFEPSKAQKIIQMLEWLAQRDPFWALPQVIASRKKGLKDLKDLEFDIEWKWENWQHCWAVRQQHLDALERRAA